MKFILSIIILLLAINITVAQPYNQTDSNGKKIGKWEKKYDNGKTRYKGQFENDYEVGDFFFYYPNGNIKSKLTYSENGKLCKVSLFNKKGNVEAKGYYYDKKKHRAWRYYSASTGNTLKKEVYNKGVKDGKWVTYYPSEQIATEITWVNGKREGEWKEYFENGRLRLSTTFVNNKLDGDYESYYLNGQISRKGKYVNGLADGNWIIYNESGIYIGAEKWNMGKLELERKFKDGKMYWEMDNINHKVTDLREKEDGEEEQ